MTDLHDTLRDQKPNSACRCGGRGWWCRDWIAGSGNPPCPCNTDPDGKCPPCDECVPVVEPVQATELPASGKQNEATEATCTCGFPSMADSPDMHMPKCPVRATEPTCMACEDKPSGDNVPCAMCGKTTNLAGLPDCNHPVCAYENGVLDERARIRRDVEAVDWQPWRDVDLTDPSVSAVAMVDEIVGRVLAAIDGGQTDA